MENTVKKYYKQSIISGIISISVSDNPAWVNYLRIGLQLTAHHFQSGEQTVFINQGLVEFHSFYAQWSYTTAVKCNDPGLTTWCHTSVHNSFMTFRRVVVAPTCQLLSEASWVLAKRRCRVASFCSNICSLCKASCQTETRRVGAGTDITFWQNTDSWLSKLSMMASVFTLCSNSVHRPIRIIAGALVQTEMTIRVIGQ